MADDPQVPVSTPTGGTTDVPASVVNGPGDAPSYNAAGSGSNPAAGTVSADKLSPKLAARSFPSVIGHLAVSAHRETDKDGDPVPRVKELLAVLKSLQDGSYLNMSQRSSGARETLLNNLIDKVPDGPLKTQLSESVIGTGSGATGLSKAATNALRNVIGTELRTAYSAVGVQTSGNSYQSLAATGEKAIPQMQAQVNQSRAATAPLDPLTRTNGLLTLLDDLETGKSTDNVDPSVWSGMLSRAGVPGGGQGNAYMETVGSNGQELNPGSTLVPAVRKAVERVTVQAVQTHLIDLGADKNEVQSATNAQGLRAVQLPSSLHSMAATDGYDLENVNTMGSFFQTLQKQSVQTKNGPGIPGKQIPGKPAPSASPGTGSQLLNNFKYQWQNSPATRDEMAASLNGAGVSDTTIGNAPSDYAQAANAFIKVMGQTPSGQNPWTYLGSQPTISTSELHNDPGYALVSAEATKIGVKLSNDQINRLAQVYGGETSTGQTDAMDQAIASLYRYDPNEDTQPGSFAATALQNIQQTFGSYGIELTNAQAGSYVQALLTKGGADLTSIYSAGDAATAYATDMAKQSASSLFPTLAPLINSGQTLTGSGGMLTPYLSQYAQMLGQDPDTVTLTPQLIKLMAAGNTGTSKQVGEGSVGGGGALQSTASGGSNAPAGGAGATSAQGGLKSLDQFQAAVMQDPATGWNKSANALEAYTNMANTLMSTMGYAPPQGSQTPGAPQTTNLVGGQV